MSYLDHKPSTRSLNRENFKIVENMCNQLDYLHRHLSESDRVSPYSKTKECGPDEKGYIFLYDSVRKNEKLLVFTVSICDNQYNIIKIDIGKCLKYPLEDNILPIFTIKGMPSGVTQSSDRLFWVCGKNYNNNHFNELVYAQLYYDEGIVSENARITINGILISTDDSTH